MKTNRWFLLIAVLAVFGLVAAACGSDDDDDSSSEETEASDEEASDEEASDEEMTDEEMSDALMVEADVLAGVCPETVVVQTDWHAEAEHGATYELLGDDYEVVDTGIVRGTLIAHGGVDTGVDIEIRESGPAIGFQQVSAQMYAEPDIMFGYVSTDEAVENSDGQPTVSVVTPLDKNPQIIMWNPEQFPGVEAVADLPDDTLIVAFGPATYLLWLVDQGIITEDQIDGSYDAGPARFVAEDGAYGQQGFASAEPYIYE
ncbi:MAG: ABC transporter substrate-binding protein, partial [Acidimicrobiales bacterium]